MNKKQAAMIINTIYVAIGDSLNKVTVKELGKGNSILLLINKRYGVDNAARALEHAGFVVRIDEETRLDERYSNTFVYINH